MILGVLQNVVDIPSMISLVSLLGANNGQEIRDLTSIHFALRARGHGEGEMGSARMVILHVVIQVSMEVDV